MIKHVCCTAVCVVCTAVLFYLHFFVYGGLLYMGACVSTEYTPDSISNASRIGAGNTNTDRNEISCTTSNIGAWYAGIR